MKLCEVIGCGRKHMAKGFCFKHYNRIRINGDLVLRKRGASPRKGCIFMGCNGKHYAKGLCRCHYNMEKRGHGLKPLMEYRKKTKCQVNGCDTLVLDAQYCNIHATRLRECGRFNKLTREERRSWNWKGGVFLYPNHGLMKKNRIIKMSEVNWKCEMCGKKAVHVHHKDKSKTNHEISNFIAVCVKCHFKLHKK